MENEIQKDARLIDDLGGPAAVSRMLGFSAAIGVQRVNNWRTRGIPAKVKISRPDLFLQPQGALDGLPREQCGCHKEAA